MTVSKASVQMARELVHRGADVNGRTYPQGNLSAVDFAFASLESTSALAEFVRDFVFMLIDTGLEPDGIYLSLVLETFFNGHSSRFLAEIFFELLRAGSPLVSPGSNPVLQQCEKRESRQPALTHDEHWNSSKALAEGVRAAGGTWGGFRRMQRKEVLRLRSLMARGRAKLRRTRAGPGRRSRISPPGRIGLEGAGFLARHERYHGGGNLGCIFSWGRGTRHQRAKTKRDLLALTPSPAPGPLFETPPGCRSWPGTARRCPRPLTRTH